MVIENRNPFVQVEFSIDFNHWFLYDFCTIEGVLFSVPRFHRYIKKSTPKSRVTMAAAVYTAAVVCNIHVSLIMKCFFWNLD